MASVGQMLVIARDESAREAIVAELERDEHVVEIASEPGAALAMVERAPPDVVLCVMADRDDLALIERIHELAPRTAIVVVAHEVSSDAITEVVCSGADHCLVPPVDVLALGAVARRSLTRPMLAREVLDARQRAAERLDMGRFDRIVGGHPVMQRLLNKAYQAAKSRATVLIHGETGTGKELIAAAIHQNSRRSGSPFVRLNCSALAESVLESELFGHEKGAFTGAAIRRKGRFEQAHLGTLFLDEVSEISPPVQVKLLRFLQEREFERVGGDETVRVDVRIVAATNRDLRAMVDGGTFREDLFYRLNVVRIDVPPLRARPSDIPALAEHFLQRFAEENQKTLLGLTDAARAALLAHPWPGNVRELQNVIEQAVVLTEDDRIGLSDLPIATQGSSPDPLRLMVPGVTLAELERYAILKTLEAVGGSPTKAAAILGVSRRTVQYRMREWGLTARGRDGLPSSPDDPEPPTELRPRDFR